MKSLTIRLPDSLLAELEEESKARGVPKSDLVRERLGRAAKDTEKKRTMGHLLGDLVGSVKGLPADLASKKKEYLAELIRGKRLHR